MGDYHKGPYKRKSEAGESEEVKWWKQGKGQGEGRKDSKEKRGREQGKSWWYYTTGFEGGIMNQEPKNVGDLEKLDKARKVVLQKEHSLADNVLLGILTSYLLR